MNYDLFPFIAQGIFLTSLYKTSRKILATKSSRDFSVPAQTLTLIGIYLLFLYANDLRITKGNWVLFYQNLINVVSNSFVYCIILRYRNGSKIPVR